MKKYGIFLTRAQIVTNGHGKCLAKIAEECDTVLVLIGSANKSGTLRNPFDIDVRVRMMQKSIKKWFPGQEHGFIVGTLDDYSYANDNNPLNTPHWGQHLYNRIVSYIGEVPFTYYTGEISDGSDRWFTKVSGAQNVTIEQIIVGGPYISATEAREALAEGKIAYFSQLCPAGVVEDFEQLYTLYRKVLADPKEDFSTANSS